MTFTQFFFYYLGSMIIFNILASLLEYGAKAYQQRKLQKAIKDGKVRLVTLDELYEMQENKDDKKWN